MNEFIIANAMIFFILCVVMVIVSISFSIGIYTLIRKMWFIADQTSILLELLNEFKIHLDDINSVDKLYGEPTIVALIEHSKHLTNSVKTYLLAFDFMKVEGGENEINENEEPEREIDRTDS